MFKLVISDIDGTFLNTDRSFNRELFISTKNRLNAHGIQFAFCTGKQCERVENIFGGLLEDTYILGDSATRIKHNGEIIYESLLDNGKAKAIIKDLHRIDSGQTVIACTPISAYVSDTITHSELDIVRGSYQEVIKVSSFDKIEEDFIKITVHDPEHNCRETIKGLSNWKNHVYMVASEDTWIDIADFDIHKGSTVKRLQEICGVTEAETMAFGDGRNDKELLTAAKYSVAMDNAFPEIKEIANLISVSNDRDGVLETVNLFLDMVEMK